jgi:hypothetical protein
MRMLSTPPPPDESKQEAGTPQPCCPVCNGPLVELRGQSRCTHCYFTWCVGCENTEATSFCAIQQD